MAARFTITFIMTMDLKNNMRRIILTTLSSLVLSAIALNAVAQQPGPVAIPDKVKADILKRHPKAEDLQSSYETHYQRKLLQVSYKEEGTDGQILELFRDDGHLFANELLLDDISEAPAEVKQALQNNFPGYSLKKSEMIANPNGAGEEYEIYLVAGGINWKVSITEKGNIEGKEQYQ